MSPENKKQPRGGARLRQGEKAPKEKRPKARRTRKQQILFVLYVILTVLAGLVVATFIAYHLLVVKPTLPNQDPAPQPTGTAEPGVVEPVSGPKLSGDRKEEFYTFMVVGRDTGGGGNTDTIMVASYDVPNQRLNVLNIPRDTMVNVPWDVKKINSVYNYAPYYDKDGIEFLREEVSYLIGFQPDYTIVVEWEAVGELVDAIDGVDFDVPIDMNYDDPTQDLHIHLSAGRQTIDGDRAMQLLRWRKNSKVVNGKVVVYGGYPNGDLGRIETQQAFLKTVIQKCLTSFTDVGTITRMARVFLDNVSTDEHLTLNNLVWFAKEAILGGLSMDNVSFVTLPTKGTYAWSRSYQQSLDYVVPIADELLALVNERFNPYLDDLELHELDIMSVQSDGTLSSTSGYVEDTKATTVPPKSSSKPIDTEAPAVPEEPEDTQTPQPSDTPEPSVSPSQDPEGSAPPSGGPGEGNAPASPSPSPSASVPPSAQPTGQPSAQPSPVPSAQPSPTPPAQPAPSPSVPPESTSGPGMEPIE